MGEIGQGRLIGPSAERVTFEDLSRMITDDYRVERRRAAKQLDSTLKRLTRTFAGYRAVDITTDRLTAYVRERQEEGYAPGTIRKDMAAIKRAFNLAIRAGHLATKPYIPSVRVQDAREGFLTMTEVEAVAREIGPELAPVVRFAALTGWRKREVLGLTWAHVDFEAGTVHLEAARAKNGEGRTFPFAALPQLKELLEAQRESTRAVERQTGRIVPHVFHRAGEPILSMRSAWDAACKRAGLAGAWFHDLRRTAIMHLERAGVPRSVAMKLSGHKTESVYRRYAIADAAALAEGVEKLARLHGGTPAPPKVMPMRR
ncbi:MAG: tyrosine-type recombinase/integrase [Planctomycetota bacterium]